MAGMFNIQPHKEIVKASADGSITVPKSLCEQIGVTANAECIIRNNEIIIPLGYVRILTWILCGRIKL